MTGEFEKGDRGLVIFFDRRFLGVADIAVKVKGVLANARPVSASPSYLEKTPK
jgi:hypothetical protein